MEHLEALSVPHKGSISCESFLKVIPHMTYPYTIILACIIISGCTPLSLKVAVIYCTLNIVYLSCSFQRWESFIQISLCIFLDGLCFRGFLLSDLFLLDHHSPHLVRLLLVLLQPHQESSHILILLLQLRLQGCQLDLQCTNKNRVSTVSADCNVRTYGLYIMYACGIENKVGYRLHDMIERTEMKGLMIGSQADICMYVQTVKMQSNRRI